MSVSSGQLEITTTSGTVTLCQLPAGPASVVVVNGGTAVIYVGAGGTAVTAANGVPLPSGGVMPFTLYPGSPGVALRAITGGSATAGFILSDSYGLAQPGTQ